MLRNSFKLFFSGILIFVIFIFLCSCSNNEQNESGASGSLKRIIMVTDQAGLGDQGFNDSGWLGAQRAAKDFNLTADFIESSEQADYVPNLSLAARKADIVVAMGFLMKDAVAKVAPMYPDTRFVFIDGKVEASNVASYDFKGEEASFIAGYLAAAVTKSKKLGIVNGMDIPPVIAYEYGFRSGVSFANTLNKSEIMVMRLTVGSFDDPVKGKSLAQNLLSSGCDVILQIAGNSGLGVTELFKQTKVQAFLISSDIDIEDQVPGKILTCVMKRFDNAVYNALSDFVNGRFKAGYYIVGFKEGAVGITDMRHTAKLISMEHSGILKKIEKALKEKSFKIPSNEAEYKAMDFKSLVGIIKK